ncbi:MAG TPA: tetratricopeptide repeat protein [Candidatus Acidoferrales bacterium]|nr:tetratricopeptide repeat protein [Candidatus Acidoferrales bacterium]
MTEAFWGFTVHKPLKLTKRATAALVLIVLSCPPLLAEHSSDISGVLRSAAHQIKLRHFPQAERLLQEALAKNPRSPEANNLLGVCQAQVGNIEGARESFERAIAQDEKYAASYVNLGDLLLDTRDETGAWRLFRAALSIDPLVLSADPHSYKHFNIWGLYLMERGKYAEAAQAFQRSVRINPMFVPSRINLGHVLLLSNREDMALKEFQATLAIEPKDSLTLYNVGLIYARQGKFALAAKHLRQAYRLNPNDLAIASKLMAVELKLGHRLEAEALLHESGQWDSLGTSARGKLALLWLENGDPATGVQIVRGDEAAARDYYKSAYTKAEEDLEKRRYSEAAKILETIRDLQQPDAAFHDLLGSIYYALGTPQQAFDEFQAAVRLQPADPDYYYKLGMVFLKNHTPSPAIPIFETATKIRPDVPKLWLGLGLSYYFASHLDQAEKALRESLALDPHYQTAFVVLGDLLYQSGRADDSVDLLRKALDLQPDWYLPYYYYGMIALRRGQENSSAVIEALQRAIVLNPEFPDAHFELGKAMARSGQNQAAIKELQRSLDLDPDLAQSHYELGIIYRTLGDKPRASEQFALFTAAKKKSNPVDVITKELQSFAAETKGEGRNNPLENSHVPGEKP